MGRGGFRLDRCGFNLRRHEAHLPATELFNASPQLNQQRSRSLLRMGAWSRTTTESESADPKSLDFRPSTYRMCEDFPHNAGAAGHPHLDHNEPQEGLHGIGTNAHPARDLLAGEAQHQ